MKRSPARPVPFHLLVAAASAVLVLQAAPLSGCAVKPSPAPRSTKPPTVETETEVGGSSEFFTEISRSRYYLWSTAPGYERPQQAQGPHGDQVQIFIDPAAAIALERGEGAWPDGTVIVKDVYRNGEVVQVAAMRKIEDGWYWGEWDATGAIIAEGLGIAACEGCHSAGRDGTLAVRIGE